MCLLPFDSFKVQEIFCAMQDHENSLREAIKFNARFMINFCSFLRVKSENVLMVALNNFLQFFVHRKN